MFQFVSFIFYTSGYVFAMCFWSKVFVSERKHFIWYHPNSQNTSSSAMFILAADVSKADKHYNCLAKINVFFGVGLRAK